MELEKVMSGLRHCVNDIHDPYSCKDCPYIGHKCTRDGCISPLLKDVLSLLKTHEPRVLTMEELQSIATPWESNTPPYLWVEEICGIDSRWMCWRDIRSNISLPGTMGVQNYGSVWRVWTLQPTEEERKAVKWDE